MKEDLDTKLTIFVIRLNQDIQDVVELHNYKTFEEFFHLATKVENQMKRGNAYKTNKREISRKID